MVPKLLNVTQCTKENVTENKVKVPRHAGEHYPEFPVAG